MDFKSFEHERWQDAAEVYDRFFSPLTQQVISPLLDVLGVGEETTLLDVAAGPGSLAAAARKRGAQVVALDFSANMLERCRRLHPDVDCRLGDAEHLPFKDGEFNAVAMNFGILHLAHPEKAIQEAYRVAQPGGVFAFSVWDRPEKAVGFRIVLRAVEAFGNPHVALPQGPPFFRFSDPAECSSVFKTLGFSLKTTLPVHLVWRLNSPDEFFEAFYGGTARTGGMLRAQSEADLARVREAIHQGVNEYRRDGHLEIPMPALVVAAQKESRS